ncbi:MAG: hypothetical protein R3F46_14915 [bacterium]|nr:hypothetical protein [bacterium]
MATTKKTTTRRTTAASKKTEGDFPIYDAGAGADTYKKGDIVFFEKVRNWLDKGAFVSAHGKVTSVGKFDGEVPYIEVSFDQAKSKNDVDLGKDKRKFLLEVKG